MRMLCIIGLCAFLFGCGDGDSRTAEEKAIDRAFDNKCARLYETNRAAYDRDC